ncbi:MAG: hypothetical protein ACHQ0I_05085 [Candidatus Lutacidiplasmatales archaeon]
MTDAPRFPPMIEFEAFGAGVGSALVCGALSVLVPLLVTPAATLAALAVAGWVSLARRRGSLRRCDFGSGRVIALSVLGVATAIFLVAPPLFASFRGLVLAGGLLPLFAFERTRSFGPGPEFSRS